MVKLPPTAGRTESEIVFETLAFNGMITDDDSLETFLKALGEAYAVRRDRVRAYGRVLPGALEALTAVRILPGVVQSALTGSLESSARLKLAELGLDRQLDLDVAGFYSPVYPKGAMIETSRIKTRKKYQTTVPEKATVFIADHPLDVRAGQIAYAGVIAVATGAATEAELRASGAEIVLPTLADTGAVVRAVETLTRRG